MPTPQAPDPIILGPNEGDSVQIGALGVRFMIEGERSGGGFSLVEHPIAPRGLASPRHTHQHEDEYTYVLEGSVGAEVGGEVAVAGPGDLLFKPRGVPHAFWNPGDTPARALEIISPARFENYFRELAPLLAGDGPPDLEALGAVRDKYGLTMEMDSIPELIERHNLAPR